jgi:hypothetical protein
MLIPVAFAVVSTLGTPVSRWVDARHAAGRVKIIAEFLSQHDKKLPEDVRREPVKNIFKTKLYKHLLSIIK